MNKQEDKLPFYAMRAARVRVLSLVLIAVLLWSTAGFVPTAKAGPVGPDYTWELFDDRNFIDVAYGNGVYVAISESTQLVGFDTLTVSTVWVSYDMLNWGEIDVSSFTTRPLAAVHYYDDRFVLTVKRSSAQSGLPPNAYLYEGAIMLYSNNGVNWTALPNNDSLNNTAFTSGVLYANKYFVGATNSNQGRTFDPGTSMWGTATMIPPDSYHYDLIVHDNKLFVGGSNYSTPKLSMGVTEDGATWTLVDEDTLGSIKSFASNGSTLVAVGKTAEEWQTATPAAAVIDVSPEGVELTKGTLSHDPKLGEFVSASYSETKDQFLALSSSGEVYYSADEGVTWHPDYSTMESVVGLISTDLGDFAFTKLGVFKRVELGDETVTATLTGASPNATTFTVTVNDSNAVPVSEAGIAYSTSDTLESDDPHQAGIAGEVSGSNQLFEVTITGLLEGTEYYYWPYSQDLMGNIYYGDRESFTTVTPPEAPQFVTQPQDATVRAGDPEPTLSVTATVYDGGSLTYQWYSNSEDSNSGGVLLDDANSATFTAPTDTTGKVYYYVGVTNTLVDGDWTDSTTSYSSTALVTVLPNTPNIIDAIDDQTLTELVSGYASGTQEAKEVFIANIGTTDLQNVTVSLGGLHADSFTVTQPPATLAKDSPPASFTVAAADGLPAGTYEAVVTVTADGMADVSFKVLLTINNASGPKNPQNLTAVGSDTSVQLSWDTVTEATYYNVYASTTPGQFTDPAETAMSETYTWTGLTNGTTYYFVVQAADDAAGVSGYSNQASATPAGVPDAPTNVTARAGDSSARITFTVPYDGGSPILSYEIIASNDDSIEVDAMTSQIVFPDLTNGQSYTFSVRAINEHGPSDWSADSNEVTPRKPAVIPDEVEQGSDDGVIVYVNGKEERVGKATTVEVDGRSTTTIEVDEQQLEERLAQEGAGSVITVPVAQQSDVITGELTGRMVKTMEGHGAVVEIRTPSATYRLPALQVDIDAVSAELGGNVDLQDIKVRITIAASADATVEQLEAAAGTGGYTLVAAPVDFTVTAVFGDQTVEITTFNAYVERTIALPVDADPNRITTGVVVDPDGTVRHVPTRVTQIEGNYHAAINSVTNSPYAVVWHPLEFGDAATHWSKDAVNDMGSRMIVSGIGEGQFGPDRNVTRAEFTAILVRGLGLKPLVGESSFSDVLTSDWFNGDVNTAVAYGLVSGFEDGAFRPQELITREQAMVMIAKAMTVTGLKAQLPTQAAEAVLRPYTDGADVSVWAASGVADTVQAGIVQGRGNAALVPQANMTRAEAAVLIRQLLSKSGLI